MLYAQVYGDGNQTRSFMYVSDLVEGLEKLMASNYSQPVNLGNPEEHTVLEFAELIKKLTNSSAPIVHNALPEDDPHRRRPDISVAARHIGWHPRVCALLFTLMPFAPTGVQYYHYVLFKLLRSRLANGTVAHCTVHVF